MKKSVYLVVAASLLALLVMPIAFAGAAGNPGSANASVKKQLKGLKQRIAALEAKQDPVIPAIPKALPPNGPAGGDLTGTYPNPLIKPNAITAEKLATDSVTGPKLTDNSVGSQEISDFQVAALDMGADSVGSFALKGLVTAVSPVGTTAAEGQKAHAVVICPAGHMLIAGGYAWAGVKANSIIASAPSESNPNTTWIVDGVSHDGTNTLYAWATCLTV